MADNSVRNTIGLNGAVKKGNAKRWACNLCDSLLGLITDSGKEVQMKLGDRYIWVRNGEVTTICRHCSTHNVLKLGG